MSYPMTDCLLGYPEVLGEIAYGHIAALVVIGHRAALDQVPFRCSSSRGEAAIREIRAFKHGSCSSGLDPSTEGCRMGASFK
jgi:hypothetical protein